MAPAFDEVDAYISYTVRLIRYMIVLLILRLLQNSRPYNFTIKVRLGA